MPFLSVDTLYLARGESNLAAIIGIHGVSSSEWFPIRKSASSGIPSFVEGFKARSRRQSDDFPLRSTVSKILSYPERISPSTYSAPSDQFHRWSVPWLEGDEQEGHSHIRCQPFESIGGPFYELSTERFDPL